jgi:N-acetylglucosamine kinase-like BadF-type ATPase
MILVADSGSTNTDWVIIKDNEIKSSFTTRGFNPYFTTSEKLHSDLTSELPQDLNPEKIESIFFYGAGCSSNPMQELVRKGLTMTFKNAEVEVNHDLLGAARALFMNEPGLAIILGTGANTCIYNGKEVIENIPSLGFILGDEGGGDHLGKLFISELLYNNIPEKVSDKFFQKYNLTKDQIMQKVYKEDHPNRFLASFAEFLYEQRSEKSIQKIINKSFTKLFDKHITQYKNYKNYTIRAIGSVAFYFKDMLNEVAATYATRVEQVEKEPIQKLACYHISHK